MVYEKPFPFTPLLRHFQVQRELLTEELEPLVRDYAFRQRPSLIPPVRFEIHDFDVAGLWNTLKIQICLIRYLSPDGQQFNEELVIYRNGKVARFAGSLGGKGLMSGLMMRDSLYYTYSWGSGLHRSHAGRLSSDDGKLTIVESGGFASTDLFVKEVDRSIQVERGEFLAFNSWKAIRKVGSVKVQDSSLSIVDATGAVVPPDMKPKHSRQLDE